MRLIPSEGSGRYSPGPGMVELLEERSYQEIRPPVAICSQAPPGILAIDSTIPGIVPAHEAGHFMGRPGHVSSPKMDQLMADGGPVFGYGKIPFDLILQDYN